ncbi:hypothetical protein VNO80_24236 [Phaseolus coccineus]|uniref:Uncharacterized protein n=1 Tax=Phaseolus coccineus TaxID=3886 RepID=A0AAN9LS53_PHACN
MAPAFKSRISIPSLWELQFGMHQLCLLSFLLCRASIGTSITDNYGAAVTLDELGEYARAISLLHDLTKILILYHTISVTVTAIKSIEMEDKVALKNLVEIQKKACVSNTDALNWT